MTKNKAIFLDRDGVVNEAIVVDRKPFSPKFVEEVKIVNGIKELLEFLSKEYFIIIITNQPNIARKTQSQNSVNKINRYLKSQLQIDDFFVCPHSNEDNCNCRKPKTGLILQAVEKYDIDLSQSYLIGDRKSDIECGVNTGCRTIFVDYGYQERQPKSEFVVKSVKEIINIFK